MEELKLEVRKLERRETKQGEMPCEGIGLVCAPCGFGLTIPCSSCSA